MSETVPFVVGVRFSKAGKIYHFDANDLNDLDIHDTVVVETSRGWQVGVVEQIIKDIRSLPKTKRKSVHRRATPRDLLIRQEWQKKEAEAVDTCRKNISIEKFPGVKIVGAEYGFDGTKLSILVSSDGEEKLDLKSIKNIIQKLFPSIQVDIRQIGPRDVAKILSGMGTCGLETRCCAKFLTDFSSISIRMAKEQGISLTPPEITGMCGRLRCCLLYEYEHYLELKKSMPRKNKKVITPLGEGKVISVAPLRESVMVDVQDVGHREFKLDELNIIENVETDKKRERK